MNEIINFINDRFKDHTIDIDVEEKRINYYKSNNDLLGSFYLNTNEFYISVPFYYNLMKYFKNRYEIYEFLKLVLEKIISKKINKIY